MFKRRSSYAHTGLRTPLFFRVWFVFCAILSLGITAAVVFAIYTAISDPKMIGSFAGEIVLGYTETIRPQPQEYPQ